MSVTRSEFEALRRQVSLLEARASSEDVFVGSGVTGRARIYFRTGYAVGPGLDETTGKPQPLGVPWVGFDSSVPELAGRFVTSIDGSHVQIADPVMNVDIVAAGAPTYTGETVFTPAVDGIVAMVLVVRRQVARGGGVDYTYDIDANTITFTAAPYVGGTVTEAQFQAATFIPIAWRRITVTT